MPNNWFQHSVPGPNNLPCVTSFGTNDSFSHQGGPLPRSPFATATAHGGAQGRSLTGARERTASGGCHKDKSLLAVEDNLDHSKLGW